MLFVVSVADGNICLEAWALRPGMGQNTDFLLDPVRRAVNQGAGGALRLFGEGGDRKKICGLTNYKPFHFSCTQRAKQMC